MWLTWLWEGFSAGVAKMVSLWWLIPLFIGIQLLRDGGVLGRLSRFLSPLLAPLRLPGDAGLPVVAGLTIGLTYGSGVIIQVVEEGKLNRDELTVVCVLLGVSHALIEETILLTSLGANGVLLVALRVLLAPTFAFVASRLLLPRPTPAVTSPAD
ncbi:MAG TPA: nucleoside recognition domain-containing protein [Symbiobacteriaceae bacterium]|nr:nucleoside recognition domain-containing protein [Symbiobacteriaceae bacterium]